MLGHLIGHLLKPAIDKGVQFWLGRLARQQPAVEGNTFTVRYHGSLRGSVAVFATFFMGASLLMIFESIRNKASPLNLYPYTLVFAVLIDVILVGVAFYFWTYEISVNTRDVTLSSVFGARKIGYDEIESISETREGIRIRVVGGKKHEIYKYISGWRAVVDQIEQRRRERVAHASRSVHSKHDDGSKVIHLKSR